MTDAGRSVSRSWNGGIESDEIPQEQFEAYNESLAICSESSGWSRMASVNDEQKEELYQEPMREAVANCPPPTWFMNVSGLD